MSTRKTKVKSSSTRRKANAKLGYGETNKNVNTLRKIEKANAEEKQDISDFKTGADMEDVEDAFER